MKSAAACLVLAIALGGTALAAAPPAAPPAAYRVLPGSTLGFRASAQGEAFDGRFTRFTPVIAFDPARLPGSRFEVRIELASADTRNSERDDTLHGDGFFNAGKQPQARYLATRFRALGGNRYVAEGVLTLNGISKPVPLSFSWSGGQRPVLVGSAALKRLDFGVGSGDWADTSDLPNEVRVTTRLLLAAPTGTPAAKPR
jgi:polyisoprenoid-binding protein YceI